MSLSISSNSIYNELPNISLEEAQKQLINKLSPLPEETVPIIKALGRINSHDIYAEQNLPAYPQAARDGFAVHGTDKNGQNELVIDEWLKDGDMPSSPLNPGHTSYVLTGGPLPADTAAVIPRELVILKHNKVIINIEIKEGNYIRVAGEDFKKGELLAGAGTRLDAGLVSLLAAMGVTELQVYRKPRVAILSLGQHIVASHENPAPGQLRDSNGPLLASFIKNDGGELSAIESSCSNNSSAVRAQINRLLEQSDLLITTGGTYSGESQEAHTLYEKLGARSLFWEVNIQPGGHNGAAALGSKLLISLSGNPAACAVGYQLFAKPVLRGLQKLHPYSRRLKAVSMDSFSKKNSSRRFIRGHAEYTENGWEVSILPGQKPGMLRSLLNCNTLIDLPANSPGIQKGEKVEILLIND